MDTNVYYYTYSTIAQTLAGAFGFLVAATLYRMQWFQDRQTSTYSAAIGAMKVASGHTDEVRRQAEVEDAQKVMENFDAARLRMKSGLHRSLFLTSGTIILCLLLMSITPFLSTHAPSLAMWSLLIVVVLSIITVGAYTQVVLEATK